MKAWKKYLGLGALAFAVGFGNFRGTKGIPFVFQKRVADGGGISLSFLDMVKPNADFYGLRLDAITEENRGTASGINAHFISVASSGRINGLDMGLLNNIMKERNTEQTKVYGLQIGLVNRAHVEGMGVQLGFYNALEDDEGKVVSRGTGLSYMVGRK